EDAAGWITGGDAGEAGHGRRGNADEARVGGVGTEVEAGDARAAVAAGAALAHEDARRDRGPRARERRRARVARRTVRLAAVAGREVAVVACLARARIDDAVAAARGDRPEPGRPAPPPRDGAADERAVGGQAGANDDPAAVRAARPPRDETPAAPGGGDPERGLGAARRELDRRRADDQRVGGGADERAVGADHDVAVGARERRPRAGVTRRGDDGGERD